MDEKHDTVGITDDDLDITELEQRLEMTVATPFALNDCKRVWIFCKKS